VNYFVLEPEVAGGLGPQSLFDRSTHPPTVTRLHYEFFGWLGDPIVTSFPVFIVTCEVMEILKSTLMTGASFDELTISLSGEFMDLYPGRILPEFSWMKPVGRPGKDDFGLTPDGELVISGRVLELLEAAGTRHADVQAFNGGTA
jgi:hypothetical protein